MPPTTARLAAALLSVVLIAPLSVSASAANPSSGSASGSSAAAVAGGWDRPVWRVGLVQAGLVGEHDGLHAVAQAELLEDVGDMRLDRRLADVELLGDLGVGQPAGDEAKNVSFASRELGHLPRRRGAPEAGELLDHPLGDRR